MPASIKSGKLLSRYRFEIFFTLGLIAIAFGALQIWQQAQNQPLKISIPTPTPIDIAADISGAVMHPGTYRFHRQARIQDLLIASGGLKLNADRLWLAKHLNLAQHLTDGSKIYIPRQGEKVAGWSNTKISINQANAQELTKLPGIGPQLAKEIIHYRQSRRFQTIGELQAVPGIGPKMFLRIKGRLRI